MFFFALNPLTPSIPGKYQLIIQGQDDMLPSVWKLQKLLKNISLFLLHRFLCNGMDYVLSSQTKSFSPQTDFKF